MSKDKSKRIIKVYLNKKEIHNLLKKSSVNNDKFFSKFNFNKIIKENTNNYFNDYNKKQNYESYLLENIENRKRQLKKIEESNIQLIKENESKLKSDYNKNDVNNVYVKSDYIFLDHVEELFIQFLEESQFNSPNFSKNMQLLIAKERVLEEYYSYFITKQNKKERNKIDNYLTALIEINLNKK